MAKKSEIIMRDSPRKTVEVQLTDGQVLSGPRGTSVGEFLNSVEKDLPAPLVGAIVNEELRELTYPINLDARVRPVTMAEPDGMRLYRRTLTLLLEAAFDELFPDAVLTVDHSLSSGGYFCQVEGREPLNDDEIKQLEARMKELVDEDIPIERRRIPLEEAIKYFEDNGHHDKVRLLRHRTKDYLEMYHVGKHRDYHHGYMVPSTGYLRWYGLQNIDGGFALRFPRRHEPTKLLSIPRLSKLLGTFRQYGDWLETLDIGSVGSLNDAICTDRIREVILVSEALHEQRIAEIAQQIASSREEIRIVLVAGPSSSGKTTFSKRLAIQLLTMGISPYPLAMDNYFVDRESTPRDETGDYDYEHIDSVDRNRLNEDLRMLIRGDQVPLPKYNFITGKREVGDVVKLTKDQIVILEGIHGLNPDLLSQIPAEQTFRVYASALTQLNLDRHNRVSTTDTRLVRRIVRDARERNYNALETITRWDSVRRGEKRYIFPYQENADVMFNSALVYEMSALKPLAEPLMRQVPFGQPAYIEAKRMLALLEWFQPIKDADLIPDNSLLREFVGGSILRDFRLWQYESSKTEILR